MRNHTQIEAERIDQMYEIARWDSDGQPVNAAAAMADAFEWLSHFRKRQPDPACLNRCIHALVKHGADNPNSRLLIENGKLRSEVARLTNRAERLKADLAATRKQRDRIEVGVEQ